MRITLLTSNHAISCQSCCSQPRFLGPLQVETLVRDGNRVTAVSSSSSSSSQLSQPEHQPQQQQQFPADVVVLAAGVGTSELCQQLGYRLPLLHKPAAILLTRPLQPGTLQHMVVTDTVFILQVRCCFAAALLPSAPLACKQVAIKKQFRRHLNLPTRCMLGTREEQRALEAFLLEAGQLCTPPPQSSYLFWLPMPCCWRRRLLLPLTTPSRGLTAAA